MKKFLLLACSLTTLALSYPAHAQRFELQGIYQRIGRLESDMGLVQQQAAIMGGGVAANATASNTGQLSAEMMRLDEEMRALRGELERLSYQNEQTLKQVQKIQEDLEYRIQELETRSAATPAIASPEAMVTEPQENTAPAIARRENLTEELTAVVRGQDTASETPETTTPMSARDLYNNAFKQLNQTNYAGAEKAFQEFTQKHPGDPLIGNAWYWLGEAHYVQRDYVKAADSFRQGYTKLPDGPKAGDNLLKLGMSLAALNQSKEACVVMSQVDKKFSASSESIKIKSRQEISRLGCK
jgi:tol-pal system protein YbgF